MSFKKYLKFFKEEFKLAFIENKYLFLLTIILFFIPMFIGYFGADSINGYMDPIVKNFSDRIQSGTVTLTTLSLFFNNVKVAIMIFAGSALFAIFGLFILANNGLFLGYFATKVPIVTYLALVLPHGIFEIPAVIMASFAGLVVLLFVIKFLKDSLYPNFEKAQSSDNEFLEEDLKVCDRISISFNQNSDKLKQAFILLAFSIVLLAIAAFVEANLTKTIAILFLNWVGTI